jgi:hypothetical protein
MVPNPVRTSGDGPYFCGDSWTGRMSYGSMRRINGASSVSLPRLAVTSIAVSVFFVEVVRSHAINQFKIKTHNLSHQILETASAVGAHHPDSIEGLSPQQSTTAVVPSRWRLRIVTATLSIFWILRAERKKETYAHHVLALISGLISRPWNI